MYHYLKLEKDVIRGQCHKALVVVKYPVKAQLVKETVGQNLFRTSNLIGSCWPKALLFQRWGSLLVLFGVGLSIVFQTSPVSRS